MQYDNPMMIILNFWQRVSKTEINYLSDEIALTTFVKCLDSTNQLPVVESLDWPKTVFRVRLDRAAITSSKALMYVSSKPAMVLHVDFIGSRVLIIHVCPPPHMLFPWYINFASCGFATILAALSLPFDQVMNWSNFLVFSSFPDPAFPVCFCFSRS